MNKKKTDTFTDKFIFYVVPLILLVVLLLAAGYREYVKKEETPGIVTEGNIEPTDQDITFGAITLWFLDGTTLKPVDSTWSVALGTFTFGDLQVTTLTATSTTASSTISFGLDVLSLGVGSTATTTILGDNATSTFNSGIHINGGHGLAVVDLVNCDTIDTDANGVFDCGSDDTGASGDPNVVQITEGGTVYFAASTTDSLAWLFSDGFISQASSTIDGILTVGGALSASSTVVFAGPATIDDLTAARFVITGSAKELVSTGASAALLNSLSDETGSGVSVFGTTPTFTTSIILGSTGVSISDDSDGAITFLGLSGGFDEDLTVNFDDTENEVVWSTSTGVSTSTWSSIGIQATYLDLQGTTASSTIANGIRIEGGCVYMVELGECIVGGGGGGAFTSASGFTTMNTDTDQLLVATGTITTDSAPAGLVASTSIASYQGEESNGTAPIFNFDSYNCGNAVLTGNGDIQFIGGTPGQNVCAEICQDSGGNNDITVWDSDILWENNATATINLDGDTCTTFNFRYQIGTGTTYWLFTGSTQTP